jgi:hypothetical protein
LDDPGDDIRANDIFLPAFDNRIVSRRSTRETGTGDASRERTGRDGF